MTKKNSISEKRNSLYLSVGFCILNMTQKNCKEMFFFAKEKTDEQVGTLLKSDKNDLQDCILQCVSVEVSLNLLRNFIIRTILSEPPCSI